MNDELVAIPAITYSVAMRLFDEIRPYGCWRQAIDRFVKKDEVKVLLQVSEDDCTALAGLIKKALAFKHDNITVTSVKDGESFHIKTGGRFW